MEHGYCRISTKQQSIEQQVGLRQGRKSNENSNLLSSCNLRIIMIEL